MSLFTRLNPPADSGDGASQGPQPPLLSAAAAGPLTFESCHLRYASVAAAFSCAAAVCNFFSTHTSKRMVGAFFCRPTRPCSRATASCLQSQSPHATSHLLAPYEFLLLCCIAFRSFIHVTEFVAPCSTQSRWGLLRLHQRIFGLILGVNRTA